LPDGGGLTAPIPGLTAPSGQLASELFPLSWVLGVEVAGSVCS
jgi:hypothetical protein